MLPPVIMRSYKKGELALSEPVMCCVRTLEVDDSDREGKGVSEVE